MAATEFTFDCPHCGARSAGFRVVHEHRSRETWRDTFITALCGVCDWPTIVRCTQRLHNTPTHLVGQRRTFPGPEFEIVQSWPEGGKDVPESLPENVSTFFRQGLSNEKARHWDAAGSMFRKALDVATKILDPTLAKKPLFGRINKLASDGRLTSDLASWAHEVRIDGNSAVHDDVPESPEDVAAIHEFARAVLLYTFTFPALVASRSSAEEIGEES